MRPSKGDAFLKKDDAFLKKDEAFLKAAHEGTEIAAPLPSAPTPS